jgi:NAD(P)-dependent dehydrogenase (short-subunit alcohol dehydrogenase family)
MSKDYKLTTLQEFDHVMTINVRSPMQLMSMAAPWLKDTGGCVVNTSASPVPRPQCTLFSVTKSCLDMLTK